MTEVDQMAPLAFVLERLTMKMIQANEDVFTLTKYRKSEWQDCSKGHEADLVYMNNQEGNERQKFEILQEREEGSRKSNRRKRGNLGAA